nr:MAG TPA: hypothetical protein [Caudoviricetes sp.]
MCFYRISICFNFCIINTYHLLVFNYQKLTCILIQKFALVF